VWNQTKQARLVQLGAELSELLGKHHQKAMSDPIGNA
jgi:hypothetical protein